MNLKSKAIRVAARLGLAALILTASSSIASAAGVRVRAVAARGAAQAGNAAWADLLVLVTDPTTGLGVNSLGQADFALRDHGTATGSMCGFTAGIASFTQVTAGYYNLRIRLRTDLVPACTWVAEDYLGSIRVASSQYIGSDSFLLRLK